MTLARCWNPFIFPCAEAPIYALEPRRCQPKATSSRDCEPEPSCLLLTDPTMVAATSDECSCVACLFAFWRFSRDCFSSILFLSGAAARVFSRPSLKAAWVRGNSVSACLTSCCCCCCCCCCCQGGGGAAAGVGDGDGDTGASVLFMSRNHPAPAFKHSRQHL